MKQVFNLCLLIILTFATFAQKPVRKNPGYTRIHSLKVGDSVPDISIPKVINDERESLTIAQFKDQLLILDFWATTCSACIEGLPKMMDLQKKFGKKIKILPVASESEELIKSFMQRNKLIRNLKIPSVVEDRVLSKHFKYQSMPHEVWIYRGRVVAVTSAEYVDERNIQRVLDGKILKLAVKDDFYQYDYKKHFLAQEKAHQNNVNKPINYVAVTGYQEGAKSSSATQKDSVSGLYRTYLINYPVLKAYVMLWRSLEKITYIESAGMEPVTGGVSPNQFVLEVKDRNKYLYDPATEDYHGSWERKYDISYEWVSSDTVINVEERNLMIVNDLNRFLHLNGRWEKREVRCLVLKRTSKEDKLKSAGGEKVFDYKKPIKKMRNESLSNLVYYLNSFADNPPVFDETDYKGVVDIDLNIHSWTAVSDLKKELQLYDLDLKEEIRNIDVFVLTESDWKP